ncbi:MAG: hypothetical protein KGL42_14470 [Betaproteobacteria bacterium]|nr:hypothetical protein [Betaproteobacteria bacterium]
MDTHSADVDACGLSVPGAIVHITDEVNDTLSFRRSCREGVWRFCAKYGDCSNWLGCVAVPKRRSAYEASIRSMTCASSGNLIRTWCRSITKTTRCRTLAEGADSACRMGAIATSTRRPTTQGKRTARG